MKSEDKGCIFRPV